MQSRGWEVLDWAYSVLPSPSNAAEPFVFTDEQARFLISFYEVDQDGVYVYRRASLQGPKGLGKSPLGAVIALAEFCGPVAPQIPWVQIAANAEEQAYSNVYALLWQLLSENDGKAARELGIDLGRGRLYLKTNPGAKLEAVSSAWGTREGQRLTFAVADETHTWLKSNGGHRLARVLRRNAAKVDGRVLELSNAHELGEESTAEMTEAEAGHPGVLFVAHRPSVEPSPEMSDEQLLELLQEVYEGAPWVDLPRLLREVRDPGAPFAESLRFYFNVPSAGLLSAVDPITWATCKTTRTLEDGERIGLGFDGSRSRDATALVAATQDGFLVPLAIVERPANAGDGWLIDRSVIQRAIEDAFGRFEVGFLYADPWHWRDELDEWGGRWPDRVVEFPTNSNAKMAQVVDRFRTGIAENRITHAGDEALSRHILAARLRKVGRDEDGRGRYTLEKAGPGRLIDAAVAAVLAVEAAAQMPEPKPKPFIAIAFE
jgi:phage terminase large subunit-like protein